GCDARNETHVLAEYGFLAPIAVGVGSSVPIPDQVPVLGVVQSPDIDFSRNDGLHQRIDAGRGRLQRSRYAESAQCRRGKAIDYRKCQEAIFGEGVSPPERVERKWEFGSAPVHFMMMRSYRSVIGGFVAVRHSRQQKRVR